MVTQSLGPRNVILGVDPSFNRTGWAILDLEKVNPCMLASGVIIPSDGERVTRLLMIRREFEDVLDLWRPVRAYFERPGAWQRNGGTRRDTVEVLSMSRAMMLVACAERGIRSTEIDVHQIRRSMFGRVNPSKEEVLRVVQGLGFNIPTRPRGAPDGDIANAIVTALYGRSLQF